MKPKRVPEAAKTISNSELVTVLSCEQKWFWRHVRGYVPMAESLPLVVGSIWHEFLEAYYSGSERDHESIVDGGFDGAKNDGKKFFAPWQLEELEKMRATMYGMVRGYKAAYPDDLKRYKLIGAEKKGSFLLANGWTQFFTVDLLVEDTRTGEPWVMEHKTTSSIDRDYVRRLDLDTQIPTYLVGCEKAWSIKPKGVIYNVIRKPAIRQKTKPPESRAAFLKRVEDLYVDSPSEYLFRATYLKGSQELERHTAYLAAMTSRLETARVARIHARNTRECFNKGQCPYLHLCADGEMEAKYMYRVQPDARYEGLEG